MLWFFLGLLSAFLDSTRLAFSKKLLQDNDEYIVTAIPRLFMMPFFLALLIFVPVPELNLKFLTALLIVVIVGTVANLLQLYSVKVSPLSLTIPFISFTPIFLIFIGYLLLNEMPKNFGLLGILLGVIGVYLLNINEFNQGLLAPIKAIFYEKGSMIMILVALLFAITASFDKIGIKNSDPVFYLILSQVFIGIVNFPIMILKSKNYKIKIRKEWRELFIIGLITTIALLSQFYAVKLALVSYVISLKRVSALFGVIYGGMLFKEENIKERFIGTAIIVLGVVLIAIS